VYNIYCAKCLRCNIFWGRKRVLLNTQITTVSQMGAYGLSVDSNCCLQQGSMFPGKGFVVYSLLSQYLPWPPRKEMDGQQYLVVQVAASHVRISHGLIVFEI
jgi:hypothetical protein